jgi:hypothetical protein
MVITLEDIRWLRLRRDSSRAPTMSEMTLARPDKTVGRVVLGPRVLGKEYVRIVSRADGSGHIQLYDRKTQSWCDAFEQCTFSDVWSAPSTAADVKHLALL